MMDIRLVVFDVDGVLTDGRLYYSADGEVLKCFNVKDGVGIKLLNDHGIEVAVISAKESAALAARIKDLGVRHFFPGCHDKLSTLRSLADSLDIALTEVAVVGDDMVDLKMMQQCGLGITPADGYQLVKKYADWVTDAAGGQGVAREVADRLLSEKAELEEVYQISLRPEFERKR